jgi:hypothetical protein
MKWLIRFLILLPLTADAQSQSCIAKYNSISSEAICETYHEVKDLNCQATLVEIMNRRNVQLFPRSSCQSVLTNQTVTVASVQPNFSPTTLPACQGNDIKTWSNCSGSYSWPSGMYRGEWKDGQRHGQGVFTWLNGDKFVGEYKNDRRNGQGSRTTRNSNYVGEWKDDNYHGQGTLTLASGNVYKGIFNNGRVPSQALIGSSPSNNQPNNSNQETNSSKCPESSGTYGSSWNNCSGEVTYANGDTYAGLFKNGKRNGQGTYIFKTSGNKYEGEFVDNTRQGKGVFTLSNGDKFVGDFKDGKADGLGVMTFAASGNKYEGEFKDLKRSGQGVFTFSDGKVVLGEWLDGKLHGQSIEYKADKTINRAGIYEDGKFIRAENITPSAFTRISTALLSQFNNLQQVENQRLKTQADDSQRKIIEIENQRLRAEAQDAQRKQAELEEQLKLAKQQNQVPPSSVMTTMANRKALVIGNDTYKSITKLLNAREDAKAIASNLTAVGYKVTLQLDLNEKEMKAALRTFSSQVQGGDEVMFFFAGHGVQLGATNYLLPTDIGGESEAQVKDEAIQLQRVLDDMTEKKAKFTLAMIDACRDNPFKSAGRNIGGRGMAPTTAATGQMVVFSAGTGQQALDRLGNNDKNKNGVFTRTFLKEMQKSGVSIDRIVKNVRNEVAELAKTIGHEQVPAIYDQVLGDFYFKK